MNITIYVVGPTVAVIVCICIQVVIYRLGTTSDKHNNRYLTNTCFYKIIAIFYFHPNFL
jgi:hypothetical protein